MNWLDAVILIVSFILAVIGWRTGIVRALVAFGGVGLAISLASKFFRELAEHLGDVISNENGAKALAFVIIFVVVILAAVIAGAIIRRVLQKLLLGWVDPVGGAILGILVAVGLCAGLSWLMQEFPIGGLDLAVRESLLASFLVDNYPVALSPFLDNPDQVAGLFSPD